MEAIDDDGNVLFAIDSSGNRIYPEKDTLIQDTIKYEPEVKVKKNKKK